MKVRAERKRNRSSAGFSLIEVMMALLILSFGLLTLAIMQIHALTQGAAGRHTGDAAAVARTYLEQVHRVPWTVLTGAAGSGWQNPSWAGAPATVNTSVLAPSGATTTEESYGVQWRVTNVGGNACLRDVEIQVSWQEDQMVGPKQVILATRRYDWGGATC